jgi:hypothetical protein
LLTAIAKLKEQLEEVQPAPGTPQPLQLRCTTPEKFSSPNGNNMLVLKEFMPLKKRQCQSLQREVGIDLQGDQPVEQPRGIDIGRPALMAEAQLWTQQVATSAAHIEVNQPYIKEIALLQKVESAWKSEFYEYPEFQDMWFCLSGASRPFTIL